MSLDSLCGGWLPSVLTRLEPRNWLLFFYPHQLGIGTPGGCEAAVHSARRYLEALPEDHTLVKLDFSNAFNSIYRGDASGSSQQNGRAVLLLLLSLQSAIRFVFFANTLFSLKRVPNKVTQLGHFSFEILFIHCCHLCIPILTLVISAMLFWVVTLTWWLLMWRRSCESAQKWACLSTYLSASSRHTVTCS